MWYGTLLLVTSSSLILVSLVILEIDMVILHLNVLILGCEEDLKKKEIITQTEGHAGFVTL